MKRRGVITCAVATIFVVAVVIWLNLNSAPGLGGRPVSNLSRVLHYIETQSGSAARWLDERQESRRQAAIEEAFESGQAVHISLPHRELGTPDGCEGPRLGEGRTRPEGCIGFDH
jgi:hypothetical protein